MKHYTQSKVNSNQPEWIFGRHAVIEVVNAGTCNILQVLMTEAFAAKKEATSLRNLTKPKVVTSEHITRIIGTGSHQGIAIQITRPTISLSDIIHEKTSGPQTILAISHVNDPQNLGAIFRCAAAFSVQCILIASKSVPGGSHWKKVAAGSLEHTPLCTVSNLNLALTTLQKNGFWLLGLDERGSALSSPLISEQKVALIVGSEDKGISQLTKQKCDAILKIETAPTFPTLNMSHACAVALYTRYIHTPKPTNN